MSTCVHRVFIAALWSVGLLLISGCGGGGESVQRRVVDGSASYDGKPIKAGEIRFIPTSAGPVSAARIQDGRYEIANRGGVPVGEARVEVIATSDAANLTQDELDAGATAASPVTIPAKYNTQTELRVMIESGSGSQTIDFELKR